MEVTCLSENMVVVDDDDDFHFHFQIIKLDKQIYAWIGCNNSANFGTLFAATHNNNKKNNNTLSVSVANILGGGVGVGGPSIARRIVLRTGLNVVLATNIPNNNPMLQAAAEKKLLQKLITLGYTHHPISPSISPSSSS